MSRESTFYRETVDVVAEDVWHSSPVHQVSQSRRANDRRDPTVGADPSPDGPEFNDGARKSTGDCKSKSLVQRAVEALFVEIGEPCLNVRFRTLIVFVDHLAFQGRLPRKDKVIQPKLV